MKHFISIILVSLLVIGLLGVSPAAAPVRAQEGTTHYTYLPLIGRQLPLNLNINKIGVGHDYTCAITPSGGVRCLGGGWIGKLGDGIASRRNYDAVDVINLDAPVVALSAGPFHTCVLTSKGGVKCWGHAISSAPIDVPGLTSGVKAISAGYGHTCALTDKGGVMCWGENYDGQLGDGTTTLRRFTPAFVVGLTTGVKAISAGDGQTCAILDSGGVKCWGYIKQIETTPVDVEGLTSKVIAISVGTHYFHTCAITDTNGVTCWDAYTAPYDVPGLSDIVALSVGKYYSSTTDCALTFTGGAKCWGTNNYGQVGDGTTTARETPVDVVGLTSGVDAVVTGAEHTCALLTTGRVKCWGRNEYYQLGIGSNLPTYVTTPVDAIGIP